METLRRLREIVWGLRLQWRLSLAGTRRRQKKRRPAADTSSSLWPGGLPCWAGTTVAQLVGPQESILCRCSRLLLLLSLLFSPFPLHLGLLPQPLLLPNSSHYKSSSSSSADPLQQQQQLHQQLLLPLLRLILEVGGEKVAVVLAVLLSRKLPLLLRALLQWDLLQLCLLHQLQLLQANSAARPPVLPQLCSRHPLQVAVLAVAVAGQVGLAAAAVEPLR